ncbi:acetyl-CoA synthetase-like protein [Gonapodya prolifera JEL478]|uniref:Acetyl-CoA synthetase-like protein n=1 Tax=Gonapodya prolifera (strain JEL478) TaxID=1344416 RepID=A0A139AI20_GONPJ|nr:acetyl-CoA synthetase-like protein [Gonapodya prolifera JEL478]|eukprot:KXS16472.1 acetyl-CoA synthetase-like protein [Gonapodya prolifera JEL478]
MLRPRSIALLRARPSAAALAPFAPLSLASAAAPRSAAHPRRAVACTSLSIPLLPSPSLRSFSSSRSRLSSTAITIPSIPILAHAARHAAAASPRPALVNSDGTEFSYTRLVRDAAELAKALKDGKADLHEARVSFLCPNAYDYAVCLYAIWSAGGVAVPMTSQHPPQDMLYTITNSQSSHVLVHPSLAAKIDPIRADLDATGAKVVEVPDYSSAKRDGAPVDVQMKEFDLERNALFIYTSGTTARPKGAVHTHKNISANVASLVEAWEWTDKDKILHVLPLHHVHGVINILLSALWSGATCEFLHPFNPDRVWDRWMRKERDLSLFMAVPTIYSRLAASFATYTPEKQSAARASCDQFRLMVSGSAPLPATQFQAWKDVSGHELLERYGSTEFGMGLGNPLHGPRVPGTVGLPFPGVTAKLVSVETGEDVTEQVDTPGEIYIRGGAVFKEYWNKPEATTEVLDKDGWYRTGDIAARTSDGLKYYKILGRASVDIIKAGGYKLSALEIERELLDHPGIADVAVFGIPDADLGERVTAVVVPRKGHTVTEDAVREFAKGKVAKYKVPGKVVVLEGEMPRNAMGKVNKKDLIKLYSPK